MASKRTKSYALVQIHMDKEHFIKLNQICLVEEVNKTDMIKKLIQDHYEQLNNGAKQESIKEEKEEQEMEKETFEPKKDCVAYRENRLDSSKMDCAYLTELVCVKKGRCSFYKKKGEENKNSFNDETLRERPKVEGEKNG